MYLTLRVKLEVSVNHIKKLLQFYQYFILNVLYIDLISSPLPSFPNKQSSVKNQNLIKVIPMNDIENAEMDSDLEGENQNENINDEVINPDSVNAKLDKSDTNIIHQLLNNPYFGPIVDFITNKNSNDFEQK